LILGACSATEVETDDLTVIVERDGIKFSMDSIPDEIIEDLASYRVVLVGETHWIYEQAELMEAILQELHGRGFRQLLLEVPQVMDWLVDDYMNGGELEPWFVPPSGLEGDLIAAVRDFNLALPESSRVRIRGIDVMLDEYGGASDFYALVEHLQDHLTTPGPVSDFLARPYLTSDDQYESIAALSSELQNRESELRQSWGQYWFECVRDMVATEQSSIRVRELRDNKYDESVKVRESAMKQLSDLRIRNYPHGTLMNVGGNHAQKSHLKGTDQEWLGDYLVHKSEAVNRSIIVVNAAPVRIMDKDGTRELWNVLDASPPNELWRIMGEVSAGDLLYLRVDDPIFSEGGILMNYEDKIYRGAPKEVYDVFLSLPVAHRIPS
jgi:hypothetical protein